jgi:hypothetical protein
MALLMKHVSERPRPIAELRPEAPPSLCAAIERALAKSPEDRWPSAGALRDALGADTAEAPSRPERREPVRYISPRPANARPGSGIAKRPETEAAGPVRVPGHLAPLTAEQREDLRLWHGRVDLLDRVKTMRRYALSTVVMAITGMIAFAAGVAEELPPLVLAPIIPAYMGVKLWKRGKSLRRAGMKLRRVLLMPLARWVIPVAPAAVSEGQLLKLAPRELLDGPHGDAIRRAAADRAEILEVLRRLSKVDRRMVSDVEPTVQGLVERVVDLAFALSRIDEDFDPGLIADVDARMARVRDPESAQGRRSIALLQRQRATLEELVRRREELARQMDNACLALGALKLDLIRLRSSGLQAVMADVSTATQEARALSREIGDVLAAASEVKSL